MGEVPVQLADRDPEALDRPPADQVEQLVCVLGERIERPAQPVVVQLAGGDPERLGDGEALPSVGEARQRPRVGEPVTDEGERHLPVRVVGQLPDRAETVDRLDEAELLAEPRHHRQRPGRAHHQVALVLHRRPLRRRPQGPFLLQKHKTLQFRGLLHDPSPPEILMCGKPG